MGTLSPRAALPDILQGNSGKWQVPPTKERCACACGLLSRPAAQRRVACGDAQPCAAQVAYFVNSGSEANDVALLMARLYSGNYDLLALRNCYHGMSEATMGMLGHHTWKFPVPQARAPFCIPARPARRRLVSLTPAGMLSTSKQGTNVATEDLCMCGMPKASEASPITFLGA